MNRLFKFSTNILSQFNRNISLTAPALLKQIDVVQNGKEMTIRGINLPSPREPYLLNSETPETGHACPLCRTNLDLKHTDVLILSQFLRTDGCMMPRRITGLCKRQQKIVTILVAMAQKAGLMPNIGPSYSKRDPKLRYGWKKYNKYFDEATIKVKYY